MSVTLYCLVACLVLRRTGALWMGLGIHTAWSWGEVFFYGILSSGRISNGHLLTASFHGSVWLTGGAFGPEAGLPNFVVLAIWWLVFSLWLKGVNYPTRRALPNP